MHSEIDQVQDTAGRRYRLGRPLGEGIQGKVYAVKGSHLAVKIAAVKGSDETRERLRQRLAFIKRLALDWIPIARPREMLRPPYVGYVMDLLAGMEPIKNLIWRSTETEPIARWYLEGGGLRRRLRLLARCAEALGQLHGKGLVYSDLSPNNVFVSSSPNNEEVWLIDADNLHYESGPGMVRLWTPGYGAPEVVTGKHGVNTLTDAYSFAVLAFQTLSLAHPLKGEGVETGEPEREARALAGELPWIDHPEDHTNRSSDGIPREIVLSPLLRRVSEKAFVNGLNDPLQRPGVMEWAEYLHAAADCTLECTRCKGTFYFNGQKCPWCEAPRPSRLMWPMGIWIPEQNEMILPNGKPIALLAMNAPGSRRLTRRIAVGHLDRRSNEGCIEIQAPDLDTILVRSLDGNNYKVVSEDGTWQTDIADQFESFSGNCQLHLGPMDRLHRVVWFRMRRGSGS